MGSKCNRASPVRQPPRPTGNPEDEEDDEEESEDDWGTNPPPGAYLRDCDEYVPTPQQLEKYADKLGMDLEADQDVLWIAHEGLTAALPSPWMRVHLATTNEEDNANADRFYFNCETHETLQTRPDVAYYQQLYERERARMNALPTLVQISVISAVSGESLVSLRTGASLDRMQFLPSDTVRAIQREIARETGKDRASCRLQLICEGRLLSEAATLSDACVPDGAVIEVVHSTCDVTVVLSDATMTVMTGSAAENVQVGSEAGYNTFAQNPPELGDSWEVAFEAETGPYMITFRGGDNSWHGILTVEIDGETIGHIDQYARQTSYPSDRTLEWDSPLSGRHVLRASVNAKRPESHGYWMCMTEIRFQPAKIKLTEEDSNSCSS